MWKMKFGSSKYWLGLQKINEKYIITNYTYLYYNINDGTLNTIYTFSNTSAPAFIILTSKIELETRVNVQ